MMEENILQISYSLATIKTVAERVWQYGYRHRIWTFSGEMGAGKTTLIHAICDLLQVEDVVSSPTFALINEYHFTTNNEDKIIFHLDWYRLKDAAEAINAGMEDALQTGNYCFIEWAEKAPELLPSSYFTISIETISETERVLKAKITGEL